MSLRVSFNPLYNQEDYQSTQNPINGPNCTFIVEKVTENRSYLILKGDTSGCHDFFALGALSSKFFLKTTNTVHIGFVRDNERLGSNLGFAHHTLKAFIVPLSRLVLHLFHPYFQQRQNSKLAFSNDLIGKISTHPKILLNLKIIDCPY